MAIAKNGQHFRNVWNRHITELTSVLLEAKIPAADWDDILAPLRSAVNAAADNLVAEGTFTEE